MCGGGGGVGGGVLKLILLDLNLTICLRYGSTQPKQLPPTQPTKSSIWSIRTNETDNFKHLFITGSEVGSCEGGHIASISQTSRHENNTEEPQRYLALERSVIQRTLVITTLFVTNDFAVKSNLLL